MSLDRKCKALGLHLSPCGRGIGRLRRPFLERTPKQSFGYVASPDAIRVRGFALTRDRNPSPQPSPTRGEGADLCCGGIEATLQARRCALQLFQVEDPAPVAVKLHAAKRAALVEIADRIGRQLGLLGKSVLAKILGAAGRAIAEVVGAMVVPPCSLVIGRAIENLEMDIGMVEPDPAQLYQILRLQPDRETTMIERLVAEIADPDARHFQSVLVGIERTDCFAEPLADAIAAVGARRD